MRYLCYILMLTMAWAATAQEVVFHGVSNAVDWITLPAGWEWQDYQGMDSFPGRITTTNSMGRICDLVHFGIGSHVGQAFWGCCPNRGEKLEVEVSER